MQLVSANNIGQSFGGRTIFKKVSFGINEGDRIGLVGPNGAGKSTLLKILMKEMTPDEGDVVFKRGLHVGYLAQVPSFKPQQTILEALVSSNPDSSDVLALGYEWMSRLNLNEFGTDHLISELSGGWKKRVALGRELCKNPDLLLLDEPTNHMDIESIIWLEEFLAKSRLATVTVTHDRLFLQRVSTQIFDLDRRYPQSLLVVPGDYVQYIEARDLLLDAQGRRELVLKNTLRRETEWLRRGAKARQTKQKSRIERAGALKEEVADLRATNRDRKAVITFTEGEKNPKKLIEATGVSRRNLFKDFSCLVTPKTRIGIVGYNGAGKSTLLRVLLGKEEPDTGKVYVADRVEISYFDQNRDTLNYKQSLLKNICPEGDYVHHLGRPVFARSYLEKFLFSNQQMDLPVEKLSGGEQSRLRIAQLMLKSASILVLDEPTNDLDVETLDILQASLADFPGAVILVTHDRYFMDQVANEIWAFARGSTEIQRFADYLQWESWYSEQDFDKVVSNKNSNSDSGADDSSKGGSKRKMTFKEKLEFEGMEAQIAKYEADLANLQTECEDPKTATNAERLTEIYSQIGDITSAMEQAYIRWSELEKKK